MYYLVCMQPNFIGKLATIATGSVWVVIGYNEITYNSCKTLQLNCIQPQILGAIYKSLLTCSVIFTLNLDLPPFPYSVTHKFLQDCTTDCNLCTRLYLEHSDYFNDDILVLYHSCNFVKVTSSKLSPVNMAVKINVNKAIIVLNGLLCIPIKIFQQLHFIHTIIIIR